MSRDFMDLSFSRFIIYIYYQLGQRVAVIMLLSIPSSFVLKTNSLLGTNFPWISSVFDMEKITLAHIFANTEDMQRKNA